MVKKCVNYMLWNNVNKPYRKNKAFLNFSEMG